MRRIKLFTVGAVVAAGLELLSAAAFAQTYPARPINIIVPYPAGGPTDVVARIIAERMRVPLGQPVIVENVAGGSGNIGVGRVARASPDGYTLSLGNNGSHVLNQALYRLNYDLLKDFAPVALLTSNAEIIVTRKTMPAENLTELIAWFKANSGKASVGSAGAVALVSTTHFQNLIGSHYVIVPYRGAAPALQDLMGGQIDMMFDQLSNALAQVRAGAVKGFTVTAKTRAANAPDIPTVDEAGLPGFYASLWQGLWAPKGTPPEIVTRLNTAMIKALAEPDVRRRFAELGLDIAAREQQTPEGLAHFQKAEMDKWWPIIKASGIRGE